MEHHSSRRHHHHHSGTTYDAGSNRSHHHSSSDHEHSRHHSSSSRKWRIGGSGPQKTAEVGAFFCAAFGIVAIAIHIAGSISAFVDMMNERAEALGCVNTHFANPHGLHNENHYTCAYDLLQIALAARSL